MKRPYDICLEDMFVFWFGFIKTAYSNVPIFLVQNSLFVFSQAVVPKPVCDYQTEGNDMMWLVCTAEASYHRVKSTWL